MCIYFECRPIIIPFIYFPLVVPFFLPLFCWFWVIVLSMFSWGRVRWSPDPERLSCWERSGSSACWCKWGVGSRCEVMYNSFSHTRVSRQTPLHIYRLPVCTLTFSYALLFLRYTSSRACMEKCHVSCRYAHTDHSPFSHTPPGRAKSYISC